MGIFYKESNSESTIDLYEKSIIYKADIMDFYEKYSNVVDFNLGEKYLFGRVNKNFVSIQPDRLLTTFANIENQRSTDSVKVLSI